MDYAGLCTLGYAKQGVKSIYTSIPYSCNIGVWALLMSPDFSSLLVALDPLQSSLLPLSKSPLLYMPNPNTFRGHV